MYPPRLVVIGLACFLGGSSGCISALSLKQSFAGAVAENGVLSDEVTALDVACQAAHTTPDGLAKCRGPRDRARASLRRQLDAFGVVAK